MAKAPKTVKKTEVENVPKPEVKVEETKVSQDKVPNRKSEYEDLLNKNGFHQLKGIEDLILDELPEAEAQDNVNQPIIHGQTIYTVLDLVKLLERNHEKEAGVLYDLYKRNRRRVGISIIALMELYKIEKEEA